MTSISSISLPTRFLKWNFLTIPGFTMMISCFDTYMNLELETWVRDISELKNCLLKIIIILGDIVAAFYDFEVLTASFKKWYLPYFWRMCGVFEVKIPIFMP